MEFEMCSRAVLLAAKELPKTTATEQLNYADKPQSALGELQGTDYTSSLLHSAWSTVHSPSCSQINF